MQIINERKTQASNDLPKVSLILTTERMRLEPLTMAHFEEMYYLNSDIDVMRYITGRKVSIDETLSHIQLTSRNWNEFGFSSWSLFDLATNEFIGSCGIQHIEFNPEHPVEFGWRLKKDKWGRGYATEAARRMVRFVHDHTNIDTLLATCHQENIKSKGVMERLGMDYRGLENWYDLEVHTYKLDREQYLDTQNIPHSTLHSDAIEKMLRGDTEKSSKQHG